MPALLKQHGYHTACIGKWHLGMGIARRRTRSPSRSPTARRRAASTTYFGISASLDMPPFAFIENDRVHRAADGDEEMAARTGAGGAASFEAVDVLPTLTRKAVEYIGRAGEDGKPFFLYLPLTSPHTPIVPTKEWQGKSGLATTAIS